MATTTRARVTSKGQVTVPKRVRERLGLRPGDDLEFIEVGGEMRVKKSASTDALDKYTGFLKHLAGSDPDELVREMRGE